MSAPFMQFYVADYFGDTQHLTTEQHGAYLLLLFTMWRAVEGKLPDDDTKLARIVRLPVARWNRIKADVKALLIIDGGFVTQRRLQIELKKAQEKSEKRANAGRAGGLSKPLKSHKPAQAIASVLLKHSLESESESESKKKEVEAQTAEAVSGADLLPKQASPIPRRAQAGEDTRSHPLFHAQWGGRGALGEQPVGSPLTGAAGWGATPLPTGGRLAALMRPCGSEGGEKDGPSDIPDIPACFAEFYAAFPRHAAKAAALKAYLKARTKTDAGSLLAGARRYAAERANEDPKFTAHPATWLNAERWKDEEITHEQSGHRGNSGSGAFFDACVTSILERENTGDGQRNRSPPRDAIAVLPPPRNATEPSKIEDENHRIRSAGSLRTGA